MAPKVTNIIMKNKNNTPLSILHALFLFLFLKQPWKVKDNNLIFIGNDRSGIKNLGLSEAKG